MEACDAELLHQLGKLLAFLGGEVRLSVGDSSGLLSAKRAHLNLIRPPDSKQQQSPSSPPLIDWAQVHFPESSLTAVSSWDSPSHPIVWLAGLVRRLAVGCAKDPCLAEECLNPLCDAVSTKIRQMGSADATGSLAQLIVWLATLEIDDDDDAIERQRLTVAAGEAARRRLLEIRSELSRSSRLELYLALCWTHHNCLPTAAVNVTDCCLPQSAIDLDAVWPAAARLTAQQRRLLACSGLKDRRDRLAELAELSWADGCRLDRLAGETAFALLKDGAPDSILSRLFNFGEGEGEGDHYFAEAAQRAIDSQWRRLGAFASVQRAVDWALRRRDCGDSADGLDGESTSRRKRLRDNRLVRARDYCSALQGLFRDCGISLSRDQESRLVGGAGLSCLLSQLASVAAPALLPDCRLAVDSLTRAVAAAAAAAASTSDEVPAAEIVDREVSLLRCAQAVACIVRALNVDVAASAASATAVSEADYDAESNPIDAMAALVSLAGQLASGVSDLLLRSELLRRLIQLLFLRRRQLRAFNRLARESSVDSGVGGAGSVAGVGGAGVDHGNELVASDNFVRLHLVEMRHLVAALRQQLAVVKTGHLSEFSPDDLAELRSLVTGLESRLADLQWRQELIASLPEQPAFAAVELPAAAFAAEDSRHRRPRKVSASASSKSAPVGSATQSGSEDSQQLGTAAQTPPHNLHQHQKFRRRLVHYLDCPGPSLLGLCLIRGNLQGASQTVKIYNLQHSRLCAELHWQELFRSRLLQLRALSVGAAAAAALSTSASGVISGSAQSTSSSVLSSGGFGLASLSAIRATAGPLVRLGPTKLAEELLSQMPDRFVGSLVAIATAPARPHHHHMGHHYHAAMEGIIKRIFGGHDGSGLPSDFAHLLDLACVGAVSLPAVRDLLLMAKDRMPKSPDVLTLRSASLPEGASSAAASDPAASAEPTGVATASSSTAAPSSAGLLPPAALLADLDQLVEFFWQRANPSHPGHKLWWRCLVSPDSAAARSGLPFYLQLAGQFLLPPSKPLKLEEALLEIGACGARFRVAMATTTAAAKTTDTSFGSVSSGSAASPTVSFRGGSDGSGLGGRRSASVAAFSPTHGSLSNEPTGAANPGQLFQALCRSAAKNSTPASNVFQFSGFSKCNLQFYNFLEALWEHVSALADFLAKIYSSRLDQKYLLSSGAAAHPFDILAESPSSALGKLIFELHVSPTKLEDLAARLGLNLSHIIIKNSMPKISIEPRARPEPDSTLFSLTEQKATEILCRVVNDCESWTGQPRDPHQAVVSLAKELNRLFKLLASSGGSASSKPHWLNRHQLAEVAASKAFLEWRSSLGELKFVDLTFLKSANDKFAFFLNLRNLIAVHFAVEISHLWTDPVLAACPLLACKSHSREFTYWIGSIGPISLTDIDDFVLGIGKTRHTDLKFLSGFHPELCEFVLAEQPDPLTVFGLVQFQRVSPPFKTYSAHSIKEDLSKSCHQFVTAFVSSSSEAVSAAFNDSGTSVVLPHWLAYYAPMLQQQRSAAAGGVNDGNSANADNRLWDPASVLASLKRLCSGPQLAQTWAHLGGSSDSSISSSAGQQQQIRCRLAEPETSEFGVCIDYPSANAVGKLVTPADSGSTVDDSKRPYSITMATLDYLRDSSPLLATLVSLACPDQVTDNLSLTLHLDHYASVAAASNSSGSDFQHISTMSRSPNSSSNNSSTATTICQTDVGSLGGIDIRSYLYQRLAHSFPQLGQHVLRYFGPLAQSPLAGPVESLLKLCSRSPTEAWTGHMYKRMLHHPGSEPHLAMVARTVERMSETDDCQQALLVLRSCQRQTRDSLPTGRFTDYLASRYLSSEASLRDPASSMACLNSVACPKLAARLALACLTRFSASQGVGLLSRCLSRLTALATTTGDDDALVERLTQRLKTLRVLGDIVRAAGELAGGDVEQHRQKPPWRSWPELEADDTGKVLDFLLLRARRFRLALRWAACYRPDASTRERILSAKLQAILTSRGLEGHSEFYAELCSIVDREGHQFALQLCRSIIDNPTMDQPKPLAVLLCSYFTLERLSDQLFSDEVDEILASLLGARILLLLGCPSGYGHLLGRPELIIEQLMMNSEPGKAKRAAEVWMSEQELLGRSSAGAKAALDSLALVYAKQALEVAALSPRSAGGSGNPLLERQRSASECSMQVTQTMGNLAGANSSQLDFSATIATGQQQRQPSLSAIGSSFRPPIQAVPRAAWTPDSAASRCMCCDRERFSMFQRRHHCRWCGRVVCGACSESTLDWGGGVTRICDACDPVARGQLQLQQQQQRASADFAASGSGGYMEHFGTAAQKDRSQWTLSPDNEDLNDSLREDFYYEQSPSASLAIALLEMHTEPAEHLLQLCDQLSAYLSPVDRSGTPNPEVDYPLLLDTIRSLLFHAKVACTTANNQGGVELCELYLSQVELMSLLVRHNYHDLPKLSTLNNQRTLQLLRDRLVRHERLDLALQVSTKCNLDPTGVWFAMGVRDLSLYGVEKARERFDRCLKVAVDKNSVQKSSSTQLLDEVIKKLEEMHANGTVGMLPKIIEITKSADQLLKEPELQLRRFCQFDLESECQYYLQRYGTYLSRLNFLMRHKRLESALAFCVEHSVSIEPIVEGLVNPAIQSGNAEVLVLLLERALDQQPDFWQPCLPRICGCLDRAGLFQPLYQLQCRTGDHVRAAMTCVHEFHLRGATSYAQLAAASRKEPLERAIGHLRQAMKSLTQQDPAAGGPEAARILRLPEKELRSLIRCLQLHLDVVAYLGKAAIADRKPISSLRLASPLPTLLSRNRAEALVDLGLLVLLSSPVIADGLSLLTRLHSDVPLPADRIADLSVRYLAKDCRADALCELLACWASEPRLSLGLSRDQVDSLAVTAMRKLTPELQQTNPSISEDLLKLISSVAKRVEALIVTGKLKKAYLLAVSCNNLELVTQVRDEAARRGQAPLRDMADKWIASKPPG
ncbi:hypothetical protein BOX15_Mlig014784g2 [Macrostomum lignano]|uniref:FYVE-type domain-containing protein n=3 Tax=Macrostomum lignano TaxID=282301 RepID=A0A267DYG9_9PLAT|nr:hypothetical protein BOX15_Mlig014784g2 [Macrostomum lignano]